MIDLKDKRFPKVLRGCLFGKVIADIREEKRFCGFVNRRIWRSYGVVSARESQAMKERFEIIIGALKAFKNVFGHTHVFYRYVVPKDNPEFPELTWGLKLGNIVTNIRLTYGWCSSITNIRRLVELGVIACYFPDDPFRPMPKAYDVYEAFKVYHDEHGDVDIPLDYVIRKNSTTAFPKKMWGCALGQILDDIKNGRHYTAHNYYSYWENLNIPYMRKAQLNQNNNIVQYNENRYRFEVIANAIRTYKSLYGNLSISIDYVVAQNDTNYLAQSWNLALGRIVNCIRFKGHWMREEYIDTLLELEVVNSYYVSFEHFVYYNLYYLSIRIPKNRMIIDAELCRTSTLYMKHWKYIIARMAITEYHLLTPLIIPIKIIRNLFVAAHWGK